MQLDSENCVDSSNNPNQVGNRYCMRNRRRKIYDDGDFKEVVKNFYTLISEINKIACKKIQKTAPQKNKPQSTLLQQKKIPQKKPTAQEVRKNDLYNFKKETIYQQANYLNQPQFYQQYNSQFSNPYLNTIPLVSQQQISIRNQFNQQIQQCSYGGGQLRRNSCHIAIAYAIYVQNQGSEMFENRDPTMNAKKKMKENNGDAIQVIAIRYFYFQQLENYPGNEEGQILEVKEDVEKKEEKQEQKQEE